MAMDPLQVIKDAVVEQNDAITAELDQLAHQPSINAADVQAVADMIRANTQRIKDMVPDAPPVPPPPVP
jgi:hypothetical protein